MKYEFIAKVKIRIESEDMESEEMAKEHIKQGFYDEWDFIEFI